MIDVYAKDLINSGGPVFFGAGRAKVTSEHVRPVEVPVEHEASERTHEEWCASISKT